MRKLLLKTASFVAPFFILFAFTRFLYSYTGAPDLLRIGYIPNVYPNYRQKFNCNDPIKFQYLSNSKSKKFKILSIGDSFSDQASNGYINILADSFSVLHINNFISTNPIQTLIGLCNGDFFDHYEFETILLENVERHLIDNIEKINSNYVLSIADLNSMMHPIHDNSYHNVTKPNEFKYDFFSRTTLEFPLYHAPIYLYKKNYLANEKVYVVESNNKNLFSNNSSKLLFYVVDVSNVQKNNDLENVNKLNGYLNTIQLKLKKKNIKLIFMPAPDKYDIYYENIKIKQNFTPPRIINLLETLPKNYIYMNTRRLLLRQINKCTDLYFYDDTHWTPHACKIISKELINLIK